MKPEGRYNLRGRSAQIRSRASDRVCRVSDQGGAITKDRVSAKKSSATRGSETSTKFKEPVGTPFPRWKVAGSEILYPFKKDVGVSVWPRDRESQSLIMENTVLPYLPLALKLYKSKNLGEQDLEFLRMVDICAIDFYGTTFNLKFEAKPCSDGSSKVYFAQLHFSNDPEEACHVSQCCLYDQDMPDIPYIHADCIVCFPEPTTGYQPKFKAGKCATSVFQRVMRVRANHPPGELFDGCYFLTKKETYELVKYHTVGLAKLALDDFKTNNRQDSDLKFAKVLAFRFGGKMVFNMKFEVKGKGATSVPRLFVAQVHMTSRLHDVVAEGHVSVCHPYDSTTPGFPPCCAVCQPRLSKGQLKYRKM